MMSKVSVQLPVLNPRAKQYGTRQTGTRFHALPLLIKWTVWVLIFTEQ